jgi:hypothetical protein
VADGSRWGIGQKSPSEAAGLSSLHLILRQQMVITELNRNHSPICLFNSSQNSAATQDANLTWGNILLREIIARPEQKTQRSRWFRFG